MDASHPEPLSDVPEKLGARPPRTDHGLRGARRVGFIFAATLTLIVMTTLDDGPGRLSPPLHAQDEANTGTPDEGFEPLMDPNDPEVAVRNAAEIANVKLAIQLLQDKSREEGLAPSFAARLARAAADLGAALPEGRLKMGDLPPKAGGETRGKGQDPKDKRVIIDEQAFLSDSVCSTSFVMLVYVLFHEALHMPQEVEPPPWVEHPPEGKLADAIKWKLDSVARHWGVYDDEQLLVDQLWAVFLRLKNGDPLPAWAQIWADCPNAEQLLQFVEGRQAGILKMKGDLAQVPKGKDVPQPGWGFDQVTYDYMQKMISGEAIVSIEHGFGAYLSSRDPVIHWGFWDHYPRRAETDTGIPHPQDMLVLTDSAGRAFFLVCGLTDDHPMYVQGVVRLIEAVPTPDHYPTMPVPPPEVRTLSEGNTLLRWPTSLARSPEGRIYVWDTSQPALYELLDDDADGLPDRIDFTGRAHIPPGLHLENFAALSWIGSQPVLQMRLVEPLAGNAPFVYFMDRDGDGFFENALRFRGGPPPRGSLSAGPPDRMHAPPGN